MSDAYLVRCGRCDDDVPLTDIRMVVLDADGAPAFVRGFDGRMHYHVWQRTLPEVLRLRRN